MKVIFDPTPPATLQIKLILEILKQGMACAAWPHDARALGAPQDSSDSDAYNAYRVRIGQKDFSASSSRSST